jgi:hypothetical protein
MRALENDAMAHVLHYIHYVQYYTDQYLTLLIVVIGCLVLLGTNLSGHIQRTRVARKGTGEMFRSVQGCSGYHTRPQDKSKTQ